MLRCDASDENGLVILGELGRDPHDLHGRFAGTKDDLRKTFAQGAVRIDGGKSELGEGRGLEPAKDFFQSEFSGAKPFEELGSLIRGHAIEVAMAARVWSRAKPGAR
jgi:hypothetical protein